MPVPRFRGNNVYLANDVPIVPPGGVAERLLAGLYGPFPFMRPPAGFMGIALDADRQPQPYGRSPDDVTTPAPNPVGQGAGTLGLLQQIAAAPATGTSPATTTPAEPPGTNRSPAELLAAQIEDLPLTDSGSVYPSPQGPRSYDPVDTPAPATPTYLEPPDFVQRYWASQRSGQNRSSLEDNARAVNWLLANHDRLAPPMAGSAAIQAAKLNLILSKAGRS